MRKFTLVELLVVMATISILVSMLLPSLDKAREESMFAVCISNRGQNYKLMVQGWTDNSGLLPRFRNKGYHNSNSPDYLKDDWAGVQHRKSVEIINPVAGLYGQGFENLMRCPSLPAGDLGDKTYSNGGFDYSMTMAFTHVRITKIENEVLWQSQEKPTPLIAEESPKNLNNNTHEGAFAASDRLGDWHSFGRKIGYTAITGQSVISRTQSITFKINAAEIIYEGQTKNLHNEKSLETWPR